MSNIPGSHRIPGGDPLVHYIVKTDKGYGIRWEKDKGYMIEGNAKHIARDILTRYAKGLKMNLPPPYIKFPYYGVIFVDWEPEIKCWLEKTVYIKGCEVHEFIDELTIELKKVFPLLTFA